MKTKNALNVSGGNLAGAEIHVGDRVNVRVSKGSKRPASYPEGCIGANLAKRNYVKYLQVSVLTIDTTARPPELERRLCWLVLAAAVGDLAPCLTIPNAQLARHVKSISARSRSVNSEE